MKKQLPNELITQLDGQKNFEDMTRVEKLREIQWCIERCEMNAQDEKPRYFKNQIKQLQRLSEEI